MPVIKHLHGSEILDSRGRPTVHAVCELASGAVAAASVPSGASTGSAEAHELRDGDAKRYGGLGCRNAARNISEAINSRLAGLSLAGQSDLDGALIALDGTPTKSRLGANAILATSLAFARAHAVENGVPLYQHFASLNEKPLQTLPRPTINLFSGGKHAGQQVAIQDVLIVPASARDMDEALAMTFAVYQAATELIGRKYQMRALKADEGGLAPPAPDTATLLADAVDSIVAAGLKPGRDVCLAVDVASSHFYHGGFYHLDGAKLDSRNMILRLVEWLEKFPIVSLEDGLAENDWEHWPKLRAAVGSRALVLGDDLLCTNPARIMRAIRSQSSNALLLKVNQIGTVTEALEASKLARAAGWQITVSARSGETEDNWLADLSVGWSGNQIKVGSINQSERLSKYNRLLMIERETNLPLVKWPG